MRLKKERVAPLPETILVTGGAGFIGSHLVERLLNEGRRVICIDNLDPYYKPSLKLANVEPFLAGPGFKLLRLDIRHREKLLKAFQEEPIDAVVHLAARPGVRRSLEEPSLYTQVNVLGTTNVLEASRLAGVRRIIFASSSSVYGDTAPVPYQESDDCDRPASPYGLTKRMGELLCEAYHRIYGLQIAALRFFTVYGPRQRPDMAVSRFVRLIDAGREVPLYGNGELRRDFTFVSDIVDGIQAALDHPPPEFTILNLGASRSVSVKEAVGVVQRSLGKRARLRYLPPQPGDARATLADISRARALLGYDPRVRLEDGVSAYVSWYRQQNGSAPRRTAAVRTGG